MMMKSKITRLGLALLCAVTLFLAGADRADAGAFPFWGVTFGTAERTAFHVGASFGRQVPSDAVDGVALGTGTVIEAAAGMGAGKLGIGRSMVVLTDDRRLRVLADVQLVGGRTWARARGASPHSTYAGVEGGLSISFVRLSFGLLKRLEDRTAGANLLFTWGAGFQIRIGRPKRDVS